MKLHVDPSLRRAAVHFGPYRRGGFFHRLFREVVVLSLRRRRDSGRLFLRRVSVPSRQEEYPACRISVIIPTFGDANHVREQVSLLRKQHHPHVEVVVVNDDPEVRLRIRGARVVDDGVHRGRAGARNAGAAAATGDVLVFLDAKNRVVDASVLSRIAAFYAHPRNSDAVLNGRVLYDMEQFGTALYFSSFTLMSMRLMEHKRFDSFDEALYFWSDLFAVRKEQFMRSPFDERFGRIWGYEDVDFALGQVFGAGSRIVFAPNVFALSRTDDEDSLEVMVRKQSQAGCALAVLDRKWSRLHLIRSLPEIVFFRRFRSLSSRQRRVLLRRYVAYFRRVQGAFDLDIDAARAVPFRDVMVSFIALIKFHFFLLVRSGVDPEDALEKELPFILDR